MRATLVLVALALVVHVGCGGGAPGSPPSGTGVDGGPACVPRSEQETGRPPRIGPPKGAPPDEAPADEPDGGPDEPPSEPPDERSETLTVPPTHPCLRYEGRFDLRDPSTPRCAWTGCALRARVDASAVDVLLDSQPPHAHDDFVEVRIDEEPPFTVELTPGPQVVRVADQLSPGPHDVVVMKRTEPIAGTLAFGGLVLEDALAPLPTEARPRSFLFIGDSITAGYGNEGEGPDCPFTTDTENGYLTYGALTSRAFDAELLVTAWSGKGVLRNRNPAEPDVMPEFYDRLLPTEPASVAPFAPPPDLVVVNLGTNDFGPGNPPASAFIDAYMAFVDELRAVAPAAPIVLALGPMMTDSYPAGLDQLSTLRDHLEEVVERRRALGDDEVHLVEFAPQTMSEPLGCDWHPHVSTHERMAETLIEAVEELTGWSAAR